MDRQTGHYHGLTIAIHWLTLLLLIGIYVLAEWHEYFPRNNPTRGLMMKWHFMLGLTVLALTLPRILFRFIWPAPPVVPPLPMWQTLFSKIVQLALYALLLVMPILGWTMLSAKGLPAIPFYGLELPTLVAPNRALGEQLAGIHIFIGRTGYVLIGLHTLASLYHHYVRRDDVMLRMLPGGRKEAA